jgi:hypothetical protein
MAGLNIIIIVSIMLYGINLSGMTSVYVPEKEKIKKSSIIVKVKCVDKQTSSVGKEKKIIFTTYHLQILGKPLKGCMPKNWDGFTLPGGTAGNQTMSVEGVAKLEKEKSYLLFLDPILMPFGAQQGVYELISEKGKEKICSPYLIKVKEFKSKCVDLQKYKEYIQR